MTEEEKQQFLSLIVTLQWKGEFFTDEAVEKAKPYTRVLLSLKPDDVKGYDMYGFLALSRGIADDPDASPFYL